MNEIKLTKKEIAIINKLEKYGGMDLETLEEEVNWTDSIRVNSYRALAACGAKGYLNAIRAIIKAEENL